jgi:hypothetical protein
MKKILLFLSVYSVACFVYGQWQSIPIIGSTAEISSMFCFGEDLMVGTQGDGIFKTADNGSTWTNINGDLGNLMVNDIRGGGAPTVIWVATANGAFYTFDHQNYMNCTSPPLANNDIRYFWFGDSNSSSADWAIGTNGGGIYVSPELTGPWTVSSNGLTGDALDINDISGYSDDEINVAVSATEGGVFISTDTLVNWISKNSGLSGESLHVNRIAVLGTLMLIATDSGIFYSIDLGDNWVPVIPAEKFNDLLIQPSGTGISIFAVGDNAYYSPDLTNFFQLDLTGMTGEITCIAQNSTHTFLGTSIPGKGIENTGGLFRKPNDQLITGIIDHGFQEFSLVELDQNYPNPCMNSTAISYFLKRAGKVSFYLYDMMGKSVFIIDQGMQTAGKHSLDIQVSDLDPGIYFYTLKLDSHKLQSRKLVIAR